MRKQKGTDGVDYFALAFHERWEVALHHAREASAAEGHHMDFLEERDLIDGFIQKNSKSYWRQELCVVCQEFFSDCLLKGDDPFSCPAGVRELLESYGIKTNRRTRV